MLFLEDECVDDERDAHRRDGPAQELECKGLLRCALMTGATHRGAAAKLTKSVSVRGCRCACRRKARHTEALRPGAQQKFV